jgi:hypothetical protein
MGTIGSNSTGTAVMSILNNEIGEQHRHRLVQDMIKGARMFDEFNATLEKIRKLAQGFNERFHKKSPA